MICTVALPLPSHDSRLRPFPVHRLAYTASPARTALPPAHFQRNPPGRGRLAVFPRCSLDPYDSDMGASLAP
jgi:hypothetical protein